MATREACMELLLQNMTKATQDILELAKKEVEYVICPTCWLEKPAGTECGLPCS